jgi:hypothetical protein
MKYVVKAMLLVGFVLALSGLAAADGADKDAVVDAEGDIAEELTFTLHEGTGANEIDLGAIYPGPGTAAGTGDLFATWDWEISVAAPSLTYTDASSVLHTLHEPLVATITDDEGVAGTHDDLVTSYTQAFTDGDYAGTYTGTVTFTASLAF